MHTHKEFIGLARYMGLTDLMTEIRQDTTSYSGDESMEMKVLNQVLKLVEDKISEVKNQAVKWYAFVYLYVLLDLIKS